MKYLTIILMTLVSFILFISTQTAESLPMLALNDTSTAGFDVIIVDDSPAGTPTPLGLSTHTDALSGPGLVQYGSAVGAFFVNITTGITEPVLGSPELPNMHLNSVNIGGAGTLSIMFTETGFGPLPSLASGFVSEFGGTTSGSISAQSWVNGNNEAFGMMTQIADLGPFNPGAFSGSESRDLSPPDPFSITLRTIITHPAQGQISSFDLNVVPAPEPGTLVLLGSGLIGVAFYARKRRK